MLLLDLKHQTSNETQFLEILDNQLMCYNYIFVLLYTILLTDKIVVEFSSIHLLIIQTIFQFIAALD